LADTPGLGDTLCVILNRRIALHFRKYRDHDLIGRFTLELRELLVEVQRGFLRNDAGVVVEIAGRLGRNDFGGLARQGDKSDERRAN